MLSTSYGNKFRKHKFRTMVNGAGRIGTEVTMINERSFVGTRPETVKYVDSYTKEMRATLLLPAGITSEACIRYKNEARLLENTEDVDRRYIEYVLPRKMKYNLESIREFSFFREIETMFRTVLETDLSYMGMLILGMFDGVFLLGYTMS